jgi:hypothetical protein
MVHPASVCGEQVQTREQNIPQGVSQILALNIEIGCRVKNVPTDGISFGEIRVIEKAEWRMSWLVRETA